MKQLTVFDGFSIILALAIFILPFALNYKTEAFIIHTTMGASLLSNVFIKNKRIKISIAIFCLLAILYAYFQIK